jgi:hypothetical protein
MRSVLRSLVAAVVVIAWTMAGLGVTSAAPISVVVPGASQAAEPAAPPTDKPTPKPKPTPAPTPQPTAAPVRTLAPAPTPTPRPTPEPTSAPSPTPDTTPGAVVAPGGAGAASGGPVESAVDLEPAGSPGADGMIVAAVLTAASGGGFLLVLAARRRRRPDPLGALAVDGEPAPADGQIDTGVRPVAVPLDEAHIPRWRRPSLRAERSGAGHVTGARRPPLVFSNPPDQGAERQVLRYDLVTLSEEPDEALGRPLGVLRAGDQVEVLEREPIWARIRTPSGQTGWVLAMTLAPEAELLVAEETEPVPATTAETGTPDAQEDAPSLESLLAAIIAERQARERSAASAAAEEPPAPAPRSRPARAARTRTTRRAST